MKYILSCFTLRYIVLYIDSIFFPLPEIRVYLVEKGERRKIRDLCSLQGVVHARALRSRKTLTSRFTDFFSDFKKKPTVLQSSDRAP